MKLAYSLFCKNLWLNLLICAQICAGTVAGIIAVGVICKSYEVYNLTSNTQGVYAYMPDTEWVYHTDSNLKKHVESGKIILNRVRNECQFWAEINGENLTPHEELLNFVYRFDYVLSLGDISSSILKPQLSKGNWFSEDVKNGFIECVVITNDKNLKIGDTLKFAEIGVLKDEEGKVLDLIFTYQYKFKVVGFLANGSKVLNFRVRTSPAEALIMSDIFETINYTENNFFEELGSKVTHVGDYYKKPQLTILCASKAIYGNQLGNTPQRSHGENALFKFSDGVSEQEKQQILSELKLEAGIVSFEQLRQKELLLAKNQVARYLPVLLCFMVMIIVGSICVSILSMIKNKDTFKAYILCGMSLKKGILILALHTAILIFISAVLSVAIFALISAIGIVPWKQMSVGLPITLFIIFNFAISATLSLLASLPILKKYHNVGAEL